MTPLVLWRFESDGGELYALTTGRVPPAEERWIKDWKRLPIAVNASEKAIGEITTDRPRNVLNHIEREGYYTLDRSVLRPEWKRPA